MERNPKFSHKIKTDNTLNLPDQGLLLKIENTTDHKTLFISVRTNIRRDKKLETGSESLQCEEEEEHSDGQVYKTEMEGQDEETELYMCEDSVSQRES